MKRISVALLLMLLSSTAHADGYSFSIGGHFIHVEASQHCRSLSCVSWSDSRTRRWHRDDDDSAMPVPAEPIATAPACQPVAAPAAAAPVVPETAAPRSVPVPATPPPMPAPPPAPIRAQLAPAPVAPPPAVQPAPVQPVKPTRVLQMPAKAVAREDDSPVGDWQTEGKKGLVRIERCGAALCGYFLNKTTNTTGETVLSNMKAKTDAQWAGDIYSRASGNAYYGRMTFRQPDTLHVEACAVGRSFCSGNDWTRVPGSDEVVTSRDLPAAKS